MISYEIEIKNEALDDLNNAVEWYNKQHNGLGVKFSNQIIAQINSLEFSPYNNSIRFLNVRYLLIKKFPFVIHYSVDEIEHIVRIYSIFHTSRNPKIWNKRLK